MDAISCAPRRARKPNLAEERCSWRAQGDGKSSVRKAEERKQQFEREQKEQEAERARREKLHKARVSKFDRILDKAPAMFSAAQLRVFLCALVTIDPYAFDDVGEQL